MTSASSRPGPRVLGLVAVLLVATGVLAWQLNQHYRLPTWLFWRYAQAWLLVGGWATSCVLAGHEVLVRLRVTPSLRLGERTLFSFSLGAFAFALSIFLLGVLGLLGRPWLILLPLALGAFGARSALSFARRASRHLRFARAHAGPAPWWSPALLAAATLALSLLYIQILWPDSMHFDARWYHMPLAEHYATSGAIRASPEGWFLAAVPQLVTYLYTWCFCHFSPLLFDRTELALHLEFVCFLFTLAMVPSAVRRLVPGQRARLTWVGYFLFPGLFLYDSNLSGAADHVGAIWVIPAGLALQRALRGTDLRWWALLGVFLSALAITKYSFFSLLGGLLVLLAVGVIVAAVRTVRSGQSLVPLVRAVALLTLVGLVLTAPHWLKNIVFYRDPMYPVLHKYIRPPFWTADADGMLALYNSMTWPAPPGLKGWLQSLQVAFTFAFVPHDWPYFHGQVPVFGPLFSLSFFCLPFLQGTRRLWPVYLASLVSVVLWDRIHHQDRYLQAVLPWMVAATLATFLLVWRTHLLARVALVLLVSLQVIWSGDIPFIGTHNLIGNESALRGAANFLQSGYKKVANRLRVQAPWDEIGASLPPRSRVLVHESPIHLGLRSPSVNDQWQGGLSYRELGTPGAIYDRLKALGVTHLLWEHERSHMHDTLGGDVLFSDFVLRHGRDRKSFGWLSVATMPSERPSDQDFRGAVAIFSCGGPYPTGLYQVKDLSVPTVGGPSPKPFAPLSSKPYPTAQLLASAGALLHQGSCHPALPPEVAQAFPNHVWRDRDLLMLRR